MSQKPPSGQDELILAMLRDLLARQAHAEESKKVAPSVPAQAQPSSRAKAEPPSVRADDSTRGLAPPDPLTARELAELAEFNELATHPVTPGGLPRTLRALVVGVLLALFAVNVPLWNGVSLAHALPDRQSLIIRDGLVLKGSGPEIYVLKNNQKRWISSLRAFTFYNYRWADVHIVEDSFLAQFPDGAPVHVLLKCTTSPHIYRLENDKKRWIKDIPTLLAEGHRWEDVRFIPCDELRSIPDGPPIPPDAGPAPQP